MKYNPLGSDFHRRNRENLKKLLAPNSITVFNSNDVMPTNADGNLPFRQNNDIFYLTGIDQEETILLVYPDFKIGEHREILFIKESNEHIAVWEGHKFSKNEAGEISGIQTILWTSQFESTFNTLMAEAGSIYVNTNEHIRAIVEVETRDARFIKWCQNKYPAHQYKKVAPHMHQLRAIKSDEEINTLQKAIDITEGGFRRILDFVKPGVMEYEIEAEILYHFINRLLLTRIFTIDRERPRDIGGITIMFCTGIN